MVRGRVAMSAGLEMELKRDEEETQRDGDERDRERESGGNARASDLFLTMKYSVCTAKNLDMAFCIFVVIL